MKFLADMGISPKSIDFLNDLGYKGVHLNALGLNRLSDSDILKKARNEGYILLTHDLGFGELVAASQAKLPSVITFRLRNMYPDRVNRYLNRIVAEHQDVLEKGAILSITEGQIRVHQLPINKG